LVSSFPVLRPKFVWTSYFFNKGWFSCFISHQTGTWPPIYSFWIWLFFLQTLLDCIHRLRVQKLAIGPFCNEMSVWEQTNPIWMGP
jgi:hypothetical protein